MHCMAFIWIQYLDFQPGAAFVCIIPDLQGIEWIIVTDHAALENICHRHS